MAVVYFGLILENIFSLKKNQIILIMICQSQAWDKPANLTFNFLSLLTPLCISMILKTS